MTAPSWDAVIAAEPALAREVVGEELDLALEAIGEFAELKSPSIMGHVHAVSRARRRGRDELRPAGRRRGPAAESGVRATTSAGSGFRTRSGTSRGR